MLSFILFQKFFLFLFVRDKKDLEICKREELLQNIQKDLTQEKLLINGHCALYLKKEYASSDSKYPLVAQYFDALSKKDKGSLDKVLDRDLDGVITTYYEAIGVNFMKN